MESKGKRSFKVFLDTQETWHALPDKDCADMIRAMVDYEADGVAPEFSKGTTAWFVWQHFKNTLDLCREQYEKRSANGAKGGAPEGNQNARKYPKEDTTDPEPDPEEDKPKGLGYTDQLIQSMKHPKDKTS